MKFSWEKILKGLLILIFVLSVMAILLHLYVNPYRGSARSMTDQDISLEQVLTRDQAMVDLQFIKEIVHSRHHIAKDGLPEAFTLQYDAEIKALSENPTILEVWQAGSRILHTLGDGHANLHAFIDEPVFRIPYSLENDNVYITIDGEKFEVTGINGVEIDILRKNAYDYLSYENDIYRDYRFLSSLSGWKSRLRLLGSPHFERYEVTYLRGGEIKQLEFEPFIPSSSSNSSEFVYYDIDEEKNVGILTLNQCNYNNYYKKVVEQFFREIKASGISNVTVDLRNNGGGSSLVANEFIRYLDVDKYQGYKTYYRYRAINGKFPFESIKNKRKSDLLFEGEVYVLTSPRTFSSATMFSVLLQDNNLAKVIGEPSGNKPSHYGEVVRFLLPNSKLYLMVSISYFERPNKDLKDEPYQIPDYYVKSSGALEVLYDIISNNYHH